MDNTGITIARESIIAVNAINPNRIVFASLSWRHEFFAKGFGIKNRATRLLPFSILY